MQAVQLSQAQFCVILMQRPTATVPWSSGGIIALALEAWEILERDTLGEILHLLIKLLLRSRREIDLYTSNALRVGKPPAEETQWRKPKTEFGENRSVEERIPNCALISESQTLFLVLFRVCLNSDTKEDGSKYKCLNGGEASPRILASAY